MPRAELGGEVSGSQIEQLVDELILLANIIVADPLRLPLPDHVHRLVSLYRSPGRLELAKVLLGLYSALRDAAAAKRLFRKALSDPAHPQPRVINTDKARLYDSAIAVVKAEGTLHRRCRHRPVQYLNNILEPDHRAIKRRVKATQNFREFQAARRTIEGYEAMHMIRKGQARWVSDADVRKQNQFIDQLFDLAA